MSCRKKIKIFIGSSITEFEGERKDLEIFIRRISDDFEDTYDIKLQPQLCEGEDTAMTEKRKQEVFNDLVRGSDMCFFIFYTKAGQFTVEELEKAYEKFKENKRPKVYVYFKKVTCGVVVDGSIKELKDKLGGEYKQYYGTFEHVDTLKLRILENLTEQEMKDFNVKQETETVYGGEGEKLTINLKLNGKNVLTLNDISEFANSEELKELQSELAEVEKRYYEMLPKYAEGNADDEFYKEYATIAARRQHLKDTIEELSRRLFDLSLNLSRDEVRGEMTERQKRAYELLAQGDRAGCLAVLNENDIDDEYKRRIAEKKRRIAALEEEAKRETTDYIRIHKFAISVLQTAFSYEGRFEEIERRYESIVDAAEEFNVEINVLYDYASYLYDQNNFPRALEIVQRLQKLFNNNPTGLFEYDRASLFNLWGMILDDNHDPEAEEYYKRSLEIYGRLAAENIAAYEPDLAMTYNNLGIFYNVINDYQQAETYYKRALEIRERLAKQNPAAYEPDLAMTYNNLGIFYKDNNDHQQAETYHTRALEIRERLAEQNPAAYEPDLASTYISLGIFYKDNNDHQQAETYYKRALEIYERLAAENPATYEPDLAMIYNNLGVFHNENNDHQQAETYYKRSLEIWERLAEQNPAAYEPDLAMIYNNLGIFYKDNNDHQQAEKYFELAVEIYGRLAKQNPALYENCLAEDFINLLTCK
ncbi:MAG: tetratricopeptide repeat protein [Candidatus Coproplasma sp.]